MSAMRRWGLFALALASLVAMTYSGVLLAFSVGITDEMRAANPDAPDATRALVVPVADPAAVGTHDLAGEGAFLVAASVGSAFPASAGGVAMGRALAYVAPENGTYEPQERTFLEVATANGTANVTVNVSALASGDAGWIVMGAGETEPRFFARENVVGEVERFTTGFPLGATFALAFLGFVAPLVALIVTHRPRGRRGAPQIVCGECRSPFPSNAEFCLRCGAYRRDAVDA